MNREHFARGARVSKSFSAEKALTANEAMFVVLSTWRKENPSGTFEDFEKFVQRAFLAFLVVTK